LGDLLVNEQHKDLTEPQLYIKQALFLA
jgi:hypothetical protein